MHRIRGFVALALVVAACGGGTSAPATSVVTTAAPTTIPVTTTTVPVADPGIREAVPGLSGLDAELAALRLDNDGRLPADAALDFFAAAFGSVPGADTTRFAARPHDGTMAMMEVLAHWTAFDAAQQQAIRARLGYPGIASLRSAALVPDPVLQGQVDSARAALSARTGGDVPFPVVADRRDLGLTADGERILGMAIAEQSGDLAITGYPDRCVVAFPPDEVPSPVTVAHEVYHCFQYHQAGDVTLVYEGERWIVEGAAEWAGAEVAGIDDAVTGHFAGWVENLGSMFALDYTAIGFYWVVESLGVDPAPLVGDMLRAGGKADSIVALGLDPGTVLNRIATSLARRDASPAITEVDAIWEFADPGVPPGGVRVPAGVTEGETVEFDAGVGGYAWGGPVLFTLEGGTRVQVITDADVGTAQFYDKDPIPWAGTMQREFCLEPGGCRCGIDGAVDPGLDEGSRRLVIAAGEAGDGPFSFLVRIPRSDGGFTDGTWSGQMVTTSFVVTGDGVTAERSATAAPVEIVVENGVVTAGSFSLEFSAEVHTATGSGWGTVVITGVFTGCGFSPQMHGTKFEFVGLFLIDGIPVPVEFDFDMSPVEGVTTTFWVPAAVADLAGRAGAIDASGYLATVNASGMSASGMEITYTMSRAG